MPSIVAERRHDGNSGFQPTGQSVESRCVAERRLIQRLSSVAPRRTLQHRYRGLKPFSLPTSLGRVVLIFGGVHARRCDGAAGTRAEPVPRPFRFMCTTLLAPPQWAQNEFGFAPLGDRRRQHRLVKIATQLAAKPSGSPPQAFPDWAELKAAYRFFGQPGVSFERILAPHLERTRQSCRAPGEYLLIEDTTLLDYSRHRATTDLGVIGNGGGRGFALHTTLAVRVEAWTLEQRPEGTLVGLLGQQCRAPRPAPRGETRAQRLSRPRGSQVWAAALAP